MEITKGELKLISRLLEMAGNEFSNHGCNDMDQALWDEIGFTPEDRATLIHEMQLWNGDTKDPYPTKLIHVRDDMVMNFYAHKLENANLAGMEPRCPKCGHTVICFEHFRMEADGPWTTQIVCEKQFSKGCGYTAKILRGCELKNSGIAQFFRSPSPTPPLDVKNWPTCDYTKRPCLDISQLCRCETCQAFAISLRRHVASPAPQSQPLDRKMLEAVAEDGLLVTWDKDFKFSFSQVVRLMAEFAIEHIASPAPQADAIECNAKSLNGQEETMENVTALMLLREIVDSQFPERVKLIIRAKTWLERVAPIGGVARIMPVEAQKILADPKATPEDIDRAYAMEIQVSCDGSHLAASPAQPEKRDEWVSVDERLPEYESRVLIDCEEPIGHVQYVGFYADGDWWSDDCKLECVTHWQPLPAPPQSGKEGQPSILGGKHER